MHHLVAVLTLTWTLASAAFRTVQPLLTSTANWHFYPLTFSPEEQFLLFELERYDEDGSRSLLTAGFETSPIVNRNTTSGLWSISTEFWDVQLWAHHLSYGFVQIPHARDSV